MTTFKKRSKLQSFKAPKAKAKAKSFKPKPRGKRKSVVAPKIPNAKYQNGREARVGDRVVGKDASGQIVRGVLVDIGKSSETRNGYVLPIEQIRTKPCVTLKESLHADDEAGLLKAFGLKVK